ncbi:hypothetical protein [Bacillus thuringiensis]|nr:hypothetical protein [Bacillus thuringiensis]
MNTTNTLVQAECMSYCTLKQGEFERTVQAVVGSYCGWEIVLNYLR